MNRAVFQQTGGLPLETDTLDFIQNSFTGLQALVALGGDNFILSGCIVNGTNVSSGFVVINGELLPFSGGTIQSKVVVRETVANRLFENGQSKKVFYNRTAQFGTGNDFILWSNLLDLKNLKLFRNLPHEFSSAINVDSETVLATAKAIKSVYDALKNQVPSGLIAIWRGTIDTIPEGWALCEELRDKFVIGAGNLYGVGDFGGEAEHKLTVSELPIHDLDIEVRNSNGDNWRTDSGSGKPITNVGGVGAIGDVIQIGTTKKVGGDLPHNNMPPYYSLAYIYKL